jgi:hypothetical protein
MHRSFLTGCAVTLLVAWFLGAGRDRPVQADDGATAGNYTYIAAGNTLYVIQNGTQYIAAYRAEAGSVNLLGGRSFEYDHPAEELSWYMRRDKELTPEYMKELIDRARKEKEKQEKRGK